MLKTAFATTVVLGLVASGTLVGYPALRARVAQSYRQATGWDDAARQSDPVGFVTFAEQKLRSDLAAMQKTRRELAAEVGTLARKQREQQALADQAEALAAEFRTAYQTAVSADNFPLVVRNAAYTSDQVHSQVSMLLAEADGYRASLDTIESVQADAEQRIEELTVRVNATETQLATLATKRELLRARQLTTEGQQLLAQVDRLLSGNTQLLEGNPVRPVRELVNARQAKPTARVPNQQVVEYLTTIPVEEQQEAEEIPVSVARQQNPSQDRPMQKKRSPKKRDAKPSKPIFQQS